MAKSSPRRSENRAGRQTHHAPADRRAGCAATLARPPCRALNTARQHGRERWLRGYQLDELFCELDNLQRCVQETAREYFAALPASRAEQVAAHKVIENLFGATIYEAIGQLLDQQEQRITESLSARDRALSAQRKSDERLRMAAEAARLGIFESNVDGSSSVWESGRMYEITGQPFAGGPLARDAFFYVLVHPEDRQALLERYGAARRDQAEFHCAFRIRRIDDQVIRVVDLHGKFRCGEHGDAQASFIGTLEDITRRVAGEDSLREAIQRKDAFLATLAHELRNPLAPIRNAFLLYLALLIIYRSMAIHIDWGHHALIRCSNIDSACAVCANDSEATASSAVPERDRYVRDAGAIAERKPSKRWHQRQNLPKVVIHPLLIRSKADHATSRHQVATGRNRGPRRPVTHIWSKFR
jgi:PAS domain-containing protein